MEQIDEKLIGSCRFFNPQDWIKVINTLASADEVAMALKLCDMVPSYYRDHYPPELADIKNRLLSKIMTAPAYADNVFDMRINPHAVECYKGTLRANLIRIDVEDYNKQGKTPHIIDAGVGEFCLPLMLKQMDYKFSYKDIGLHMVARERAHEMLHGYIRQIPKDDQPVIFVATELIEHLWHEADIYVEFLRAGGKADIVHISTPLYTFDGMTDDPKYWESKGDLGHLRTYTPNELSVTVAKMFPQYDFLYYKSQIQHLRGVLKCQK